MHVESTELVSNIWNESRNRIKGFIVKRVRNEADAEDVLQNVFFKIHLPLVTASAQVSTAPCAC